VADDEAEVSQRFGAFGSEAAETIFLGEPERCGRFVGIILSEFRDRAFI
jgi:hypothetical protein